jgi:hypothetical protein
MNQHQSMSGNEIVGVLVALVVISAIVLIAITAGLNGFLNRFSRESMQAIAVLLVFAIPLAFLIGVLVGAAWHTARSARTLPPLPPVVFDASTRRVAPLEFDEWPAPMTAIDADDDLILNLLNGR